MALLHTVYSVWVDCMKYMIFSKRVCVWGGFSPVSPPIHFGLMVRIQNKQKQKLSRQTRSEVCIFEYVVCWTHAEYSLTCWMLNKCELENHTALSWVAYLRCVLNVEYMLDKCTLENHTVMCPEQPIWDVSYVRIWSETGDIERCSLQEGNIFANFTRTHLSRELFDVHITIELNWVWIFERLMQLNSFYVCFHWIWWRVGGGGLLRWQIEKYLLDTDKKQDLILTPERYTFKMILVLLG